MLIKTPDSPLDSIRSILEGAKYACITSPYIKEAFIQRIKSSLSRISTVKTLVRLTNYEISTRTVDLSALDILKELGEVRCLSTLHAKTLLTDQACYIGSLNFTMAGFFRNIEAGVISKNPELLSELKHFFNEAWILGKSYREVRDQLEVDAVTLETVSWAKIREWWEFTRDVDLTIYNPSVAIIVLLPMPKPPLSRRNLIVSKVIEWCDERSTVEVVFCSELYGAIPMMFADDFGSTGEYCFDEPKRLDKWRQIAEQEQLFPEFCKTLANWADRITNYFHQPTTSGIVEGINNKIKLIKRRAFEFRNFEYFRIRVMAAFV